MQDETELPMLESLSSWNCVGRQLVAVTVTFYPDLELLQSQFANLPIDCRKLVVDNASPPEIQQALASLSEVVPNLLILVNPANVGLAAAVNQGMKFAQERYPEVVYCLLLDQDTQPASGSVGVLVAALEALESCGERVAAVGPLLLDEKTGLAHGFHQPTKWCWRRVYPARGASSPVPCANLNGSGTVARLDLLLQIGGLEEGLYIDHVDTEWAFRVLAQGYTLWGVPAAVFLHRMGRASISYWLFGWRVWPVRSALRHQYLFRNAVKLMRRPYVPKVWKFWAVVKLVITFTVHALFDRHRGRQVRAMLLGVLEGLRNETGIHQ